LRQGRLGHVQARGRMAKMQLFGHGHKLAPQPQLDEVSAYWLARRLDRRLTHMLNVLINA
jgi:hypothetical protein